MLKRFKIKKEGSGYEEMDGDMKTKRGSSPGSSSVLQSSSTTQSENAQEGT